MLILRAGWFYTRLILANLQFLSWFFWRQYFKTQVVGVSLAWLLIGGLLVGRQLTLWQLPNTAPNPSFSSLTQNHEVTWRLATSTQINWLCQQLDGAKSLQPTHRDILINLSFCRTLENRNNDSQTLWQTAKQLDPNALIFTSKPIFVSKIN
jgi:hypothetical protein